MTLPTTTEVEEVKDYLRINHDHEDHFIQTLMLVAMEDLADSGIKKQDTSRYKIAVMLMVANHYEQRRSYAVGQVASKLPFSLERIILQLKADELGEPS